MCLNYYNHKKFNSKGKCNLSLYIPIDSPMAQLKLVIKITGQFLFLLLYTASEFHNKT